MNDAGTIKVYNIDTFGKVMLELVKAGTIFEVVEETADNGNFSHFTITLTGGY